jgi:Tle cognate immunity protein 4 C-terminal domain/Tle cognate immunity protein 4 N-terminal domain
MRVHTISRVTCLVLLAVACNGNKPLMQQEKFTTMSELMTELETRCVGRYLIDVPEGAITFGSAMLQGVKFESAPMSEEEYSRKAAAYEVQLKATKSALGYRFLYAYGEARQKGSRYFVRLQSVAEASDGARVIEAFKWSHGYRIKLQIEATDFTHSVFRNEVTVRESSIQNDVPEKLRLVFDLLDAVVGRDEEVIPAEPGVCFLGGFLPGAATDKEDLYGSFVLRDKRDVSFILQTDSSIRESTSLLERGDNINAVLRQRDGHTIRKGAVDLPGIQGEEWLSAGTTDQRVPGHNFTLEANSKIGNARTPLVVLDMDNGGIPPEDESDRRTKKASLTEGEAIALWARVSRTLRPRPNGL